MKIGLEVHLQLPTRSKLFCSCSTASEGPNTSVCPTCLGFPGSRPRLNLRALEMGLLIAKFLNCKVPETTWFSRKTYFYPDLPKNFQITQYDSPIGSDGSFPFNGKDVRITRVHIEEDPGRIRRAGKSGEEVSLVDYNRSGVPLVEIVTAPDLSSPSEARDFLADLLTELRDLVGLSTKDEQTVRVDSNISVGAERVEIKNILGLRNMERALSFEASRQRKMIKAGRAVARETRHYDEERKVTVSARGKESEEDYGYIGEPDLGVVHVGAIAAGIVVPETPLRRSERMSQAYGVDRTTSRQIVVTSSGLADLFERLSSTIPADVVATWILGPISSNWGALERRMDDRLADEIAGVIKAVASAEMTDSEARMRIGAMASGERLEREEKVGERKELASLVASILDQNPGVVSDSRTNKRAANFVIGEVMKQTGGKYSSADVVEAVRREIDKRLSAEDS